MKNLEARCEGKKTYASLQAAKKVIILMRRKRVATRALVYYECPLCHGYHVGNRPDVSSQ